MGRTGLLWRDGKVGFPSVLELSAYLLLFTNLSFRGMYLGVTAGLLVPEEQNKQGLCSEAVTVTPARDLLL